MITGKTILITGASTGIGAETARQLAKGNYLLLHYRSSKAETEAVLKEVTSSGGQAELFQADLSTESGCIALADAVTASVDHLDALINNAGDLVERRPLSAMDWALLEKVFALNVFSVFELTSLLLPLLEKGTDPNVVNVTSIAQRHGAPHATPYGAAKSAIDAFTRGAARELAPGIRVNAVAPGVILTPFHKRYTTEERMEIFRKDTALQRHGESRHVALTILHLLENDFLTGETIDVNGGLWMR